MEGLIDTFRGLSAGLPSWLDRTTLVLIGSQAGFLLVSLAAAYALRRATCVWSDGLIERIDPRLRPPRLMAAWRRLVLPGLWLLLLWPAGRVLRNAGWSGELVGLAAALLGAWILIRAVSGTLRDPVVARLLAIAVWTVVALDLADLLDPALALLDEAALTIGRLRLSAYTLLKGTLVLGLLLWLAGAAARIADVKLQKASSLTPSMQVLAAKLAKLALIVLAVLVGLTTIGVDITALTVFGGAIGVGIGLGLQKVASNLISGLILLMDKSIKPGDVIQLDDGLGFGWITSLGARYVSVRARDGRHHLIPNEDLITNRVVNWSFSGRQVRLQVEIGVAFESDLDQVRALLLAATTLPRRVLKEPPPVCNLLRFGESRVEFQLRFWIEDPQAGVTNVKSEVLFAAWRALRREGIVIPYPRSEVTIAKPPTRTSW